MTSLVNINNGDTGLQSRTKINDSFDKVNGLVDNIQGGINPLTAPNVVLTGSSLTQRSTSTPPRVARIDDVALHLGFSGTIINDAVSGNTIKENSEYWVSDIRGQSYATKNDACIFVTNGNDVSSGRPYATDDYANLGLQSDLAIDWLERYNNAKQDVGIVIPTSTTLRLYPTPPSVDPNDLPGTQDNGSYPYNQNIFLPLIAQFAPTFYKNNNAVIDGYSFIEKSPWSVTEEDGIHLTPFVQHCFVENLLLETKRIFDKSTADVTGKSVIVYPQNRNDFLTDEVGYTPNILMNAKVIDTNNNAVQHLYFRYEGGTLTNENGINGTARVADTDLHGDLLLLNTTFAAGITNVSDTVAGYVSAVLGGMKPGQEVIVTMAACRNGSNATSRQGSITINGTDYGIHDAANNAVSNQFGPVTVRADINGEVRLKSIPVVDNGYSYLGPVKYEFT